MPRRCRGSGPPGRTAALAVVVAVLAMVAAVGCERRPVAPVSPGQIENTPVALLVGTAGLPTAPPTATSPAAATRVLPAPESLDLPADFTAGVFAAGVGGVRVMALAPNGDVFATAPRDGRILVLPDRDRDGVADEVAVFAEGEGVNQPHGLVFMPGALYVANTDGVVRWPYETGDLRARGTPEPVLALPGGGQGWSRPLIRAPDGYFYVGVGASCEACVEADPRRAAVVRFNEAGTLQAYSIGLHEPAGLALQPGTGRLWVTEDGRGGLGDDLPPEELNLLAAGADFGWPHCYGDREYDPTLGAGGSRCLSSTTPIVTFPAHSDPAGLTFYRGQQFPAEWRDDLFVALHGSVDRGLPSGYKVVRVPFDGGQPTGAVEDFATGWLRPDTRRWGRPVDVLPASDGSLLVADDAGERIYRIYYQAPPTPVPTPLF